MPRQMQISKVAFVGTLVLVSVIAIAIGVALGFTLSSQSVENKSTTLTEWVLSEGDANVVIFVSGTCSYATPTENLNFTTTTTYIEPANMSGNLHVVITTLNSYTILNTEYFTTSGLWFSATTSTGSGCPPAPG